MIFWLLAQLVFWLAVMGLIVCTATAAILAPPYLAYRLLRRRTHLGL